MSDGAIHLWFRHVGVVEVITGLMRSASLRVLFLAPGFSPAALRLLAIIGVPHKVVEPQLGGDDGTGLARTYKSEHRLYLATKDLVEAESGCPTHLSPDEFRLFLGSYFIIRNRDAVAYATAVEAGYADQPAIRVLCFLRFPAMGAFAARQLNRLTRPGFTVVAQFDLRALVECVRPIPGHPLALLSQILRRRPERAQVSEGARAAGIVLEQGYWRSLESFPHSGHMYWIAPSGIAPERIALYCNRPDTPANEVLIGQAGRHGLGWIDGASPVRHLDDPLASILRSQIAAWPVRPRDFRAESWLRWSLAAASAVSVDAYGDLLTRYNVAAIHHFSEYSPDTLSMCVAARRKGAITVWNVWSVIPFLIARYNFAMADLILAWGPVDSSFHKVNGFGFKAIAEVGMVSADGEAPGDAAAAAEVRARFSPKVRFVITVFDNGFGWENHNSEAHFRAFFGTLCQLCAAHPDWGMLIKPKRPAAPGNFPGAWDQLKALMDDGRCVIVEPPFSVGVASLAADLIVGCPMNSAAIVGAMRGRPLAQLDMTGLTRQPLFESGLAHGLVHEDPASFAATIERIAQGDDPHIGRISVWLPELDPFQDGGAARRAGTLIAEYLRRWSDEGADKALDLAIADYMDQHGRDRVILPGDSHDRLWAPYRSELMCDSTARLTDVAVTAGRAGGNSPFS